MRYARLPALLGLVAAAVILRAEADELNAWPLVVLERDSGGRTQSWSAIGPLFFSEPGPGPDVGHASGFRPFYVEQSGNGSVKTDILYPLYFHRQYPDSYQWSILHLINGEGFDASVAKAGGPVDRHLDVWPFYFSHETGDPVDTYHGLWPIYGTIKYRLYHDRIFWAPFPLYVVMEKKGAQTTYVPWPFVWIIRGSEDGFALWPLAGATKGPGPARHSFYIWPLIWDNKLVPAYDAPEGAAPPKEFGFLPFYTRDTAPGSVSENYLWPFFGYTEKTTPYRYSEQRYFWPFFVQGHGDNRLVNRWGPFYTHSIVKGVDKTWVGWPFWHRETWADSDTRETRTQFFYFLYWSLDETSVSRPAAAPAYKRHFWPILSIWDNGAGSRQVQALSPMEVFFPDNPDMREAWSPLFAIYRHNRGPTGETRDSLLWNAVTWRRGAGRELVEFHLGPLVGMSREPGGPSWRILGFDFGAKQNKVLQPIR